jgi:hypothetical protein
MSGNLIFQGASFVQSPFVILTGASGAGKTTIAQAVEDGFPEITVYQGDRIGLPSEEILAGFGPAEGPGGHLQRGFALHWIGEIAPTLSSGRPVLLEAQCRVAFLQEALKKYGVTHARVILVECEDKSRDARLIHDRLQPDLANEDMRNWSRFLHQEALDAGYEILDTTHMPLTESVSRIVSYLRV